jgi:biotin carboxyl carrier protein
MPGLVIRLTSEVGASVSEGDEILVIEAMKMEVAIKATCSGTVTAISVNPGDKITAGQTIACIN